MFITLIFFWAPCNLLFSQIFCYVLENFDEFNEAKDDYDIVYMPLSFSNQEAFGGDQKEAEEIPLEFTAFGR